MTNQPLDKKWAHNLAHCFGYYPDPGWDELIDKLFTDITAINPEVQVAQVKEKFGGLRFYLHSGGSPEINELVDKAEAASFDICGACGAPGRLGGRGWVKTRCDECREKENTK